MDNAAVVRAKALEAKLKGMEQVLGDLHKKVKDAIDAQASNGLNRCEMHVGTSNTLHKDRQKLLIDYLKLKGFTVINMSSVLGSQPIVLRIDW